MQKIFIICAEIILLIAPILFLSQFRPYYFNAFDRYRVPIAESERYQFHEILNYLLPIPERAIPVSHLQEFYSHEDIQHMHDVRNIFLVLYCTVLICVLCLFVANKARLKSEDTLKSLTELHVCLITLFALLGLFVAFTWSQSFITLHKILFPQNTYWLLDPATSNLIKFLPNQVFQELGLAYLLLLFLELTLMKLVLARKTMVIQ